MSKALYYCNICETHVIENSKHCAICNRCCYEFDHHCRWVSNDIGEHNYLQFMRMLLWVILTLTLNVILCITTFSVGEDNLRSDYIEHYELLILNGVTLVVVFLFLGIVIKLFIFHKWLMKENLTTFKHLKMKQ